MLTLCESACTTGKTGVSTISCGTASCACMHALCVYRRFFHVGIMGGGSLSCFTSCIRLYSTDHILNIHGTGTTSAATTCGL
jgi:hypothetical protein